MRSAFDHTYTASTSIGHVHVAQSPEQFTYDHAYDPCGNLCNDVADTSVKASPFKFSSKYTDGETGLIYYGYRYNAPEMGRWISRDPLEEQWCRNLFIAANNDSIGHIDENGDKPRDGQPPCRGNPQKPPSPAPPSRNVPPLMRTPMPEDPAGTADTVPGAWAGGVATFVADVNAFLNKKDFQKGLQKCAATVAQKVPPACKCCVLWFLVYPTPDQIYGDATVVLYSATVMNSSCDSSIADDTSGGYWEKKPGATHVPVYIPW